MTVSELPVSPSILLDDKRGGFMPVSFPVARFNPTHGLLITSLLVSAMLLISCNGTLCFFFSSTPVITTFTPNVAFVGGGQVRLTVVGTNFGSDTVVVLSDGTELRPTSVVGSQMIVIIPADRLVVAGAVIVRAFNPCGGFSNSVTVRIVV